MAEADEFDIPPKVRRAFEKVSSELINHALEELEFEGYLVPMAAVLLPSHVSVWIDSEDDQTPEDDPDAAIELHRKRLRLVIKEKPVEATGISMEVSVESPDGSGRMIDAIAIELEHISGDYQVCFAPLIEDSEGRLDVGELWACVSESRIFAPGKPES